MGARQALMLAGRTQSMSLLPEGTRIMTGGGDFATIVRRDPAGVAWLLAWTPGCIPSLQYWSACQQLTQVVALRLPSERGLESSGRK